MENNMEINPANMLERTGRRVKVLTGLIVLLKLMDTIISANVLNDLGVPMPSNFLLSIILYVVLVAFIWNKRKWPLYFMVFGILIGLTQVINLKDAYGYSETLDSILIFSWFGLIVITIIVAYLLFSKEVAAYFKSRDSKKIEGAEL